MTSAPFAHHLPTTIEAAATLLARHAPDGGRIIAGGQSLLPMMALRLAQPTHLIDINAIPGLDKIEITGAEIRIGATVRHAAMRHLPPTPISHLLGAIASHVAHTAIRNRGTVCGSLAHADPASEWCLALAALGGTIIAHGPSGDRHIPADAWFQGIMTTALAPDELVTQVRFNLPPANTICGFQETSRRAGDFAMAMAVATYRRDSGKITTPTIAIGGAEPIPRRLPAAETILHGQPPSDALFRLAADQAAAEITPMTDHQIDADLRRDLVKAMTHRALKAAA